MSMPQTPQSPQSQSLSPEKRIKAEFKIKAQKEPEKYYPVSVLKEEGFERKKCAHCSSFFWTADPKRTVCGEPECSGGYTFIGKSPAGVKMDYIEVWKKFAQIFKGFGYTPIARYPVAARWRDDTDFVQASIYDFQPYVVVGEIDPPANPLVVPQFCVRFNDIDNVGVTGRHYSGFVMIGQHAFMQPEDYKPEDYLRHIYKWLTEGVKIPKTEIQFHEDAWAGGGNMGPSIEFFSGGLELGNQVYMQYDVKTGTPRELNIKVLDMGTGQERYAWFTNGAATSYETVFPTVCQKLYKITGLSPDKAILAKFLPYSGLLNVDEVEDIEKVWIDIGKKIGIDAKKLKEHIMPLAGLYSIGDHTRSLLVALADGVLPSNAGGGYNLRVLFRRAEDIIEKYGWKIELSDVCMWHAQYLKPQYPELIEKIGDVQKILSVEKRKYAETREKSKRIVSELKGTAISEQKLIELYDSNGISPQMLKKEGLDADAPSDFFKKVAERHEKTAPEAQTKKAFSIETGNVPDTEILYFSDYALAGFEAKILKIICGADGECKYIILDKTAFYPTSGGQMHDTGRINGFEVADVFKQGGAIIHEIRGPVFASAFASDLKEGAAVKCEIDFARRKQLAQHHTAAHIINGAARAALGSHIWQAGAEKTPEKGRLDITHYDSLADSELEKIESLANDIVKKDIAVESCIMDRAEAEKKYGFRIYQGGAVPGKKLRIVTIKGVDAEACGGTHLKSTKEAEQIKILGASKIQDGIVRIEFAAGDAAKKYAKTFGENAEEIRRLIEKITKGKVPAPTGAQIRDAANALSVPPEKLLSALERFYEEFESQRKSIRELESELKKIAGKIEEAPKIGKTLEEKIGKKIEETVGGNLRAFKGYREFSEHLFESWKKERKKIDELKQMLARSRAETIKSGSVELVDFDSDTMRKIAEKLPKVLLANRSGVFVFKGSEAEFEKLKALGAKGGGAEIKQGKINPAKFDSLKRLFADEWK